MSTPSTVPAEAKPALHLDNAQSFLQEINCLHRASVGVVMVRGREPFRIVGVLRDFASQAGDAGKALPFKSWTCVNGWTEYKANSNEIESTDNDPAGKNTMDAMAALKKFREKSPKKGTDGKQEFVFPDGIYAMMYPHFTLADGGKTKHPGMVQLLKEYVQEFAASKKRLFVLVPDDFQLPHELEDDVVIVDFSTPGYNERHMLVSRLFEQAGAKSPKYEGEDLRQIINVLGGMTSHEVSTALARSLAANRATLPNTPIADFLSSLNAIKTEAIRRTAVLELQQPEDMSNVGGLDNLKEWVGERAYCFTEDARTFGVDTPKGIALIGPPGTGKSLAAKAIASTLRLPMVRFDISRVFQGIVGSTEATIRSVLKMVDSIAPVVLFIDEVDKALGNSHGSSGDSGVSQRVLGTLLTWMNDTKAPVFVVVTANRVDNLPAEFLRKGRLDEVFCVGLPNALEREEVLKIHLRKRKQDVSQISDLALAVAKEGYVPAELEAAVKEAVVKAFNAKMTGKGNGVVTGQLIADQLSCMNPLSESFKQQFQAMSEWAANNARPASNPINPDDKLNIGTSLTGNVSALGGGGVAPKLDLGSGE